MGFNSGFKGLMGNWHRGPRPPYCNVRWDIWFKSQGTKPLPAGKCSGYQLESRLGRPL